MNPLGAVLMAESATTGDGDLDLSRGVSTDLLSCNTKQMKFSDEYSQRKWDRMCIWMAFKAGRVESKNHLAVSQTGWKDINMNRKRSRVFIDGALLKRKNMGNCM